MAVTPDKADAPLIVDANRVLSLAISLERFQLIARRRSQDSQFGSGVKLEQFTQRHAFNGAEAPAVVIVKKVFRLLRGEALDHTPRILRGTLYVKRLYERNPDVGWQKTTVGPPPAIPQLRRAGFGMTD